VVYAFVAAGGCFGMWRMQGRRARKANSPLLDVDVHQWLMDGAISSAVGVAFIVGAVLERGPLAEWVAYLDPLLVIVLVAVTIRVPIGVIRTNLWELLLGAPDRELQERLSDGIVRVLAGEGLDRYRLRMVRAGRSHMLLLHVLVEDDARSVGDLDELRRRLRDTLPADLPSVSLDVVFTRDERWLG
jgi:predicted Co/Zn/Cd cation transporter (cation efflux family)